MIQFHGPLRVSALGYPKARGEESPPVVLFGRTCLPGKIMLPFGCEYFDGDRKRGYRLAAFGAANALEMAAVGCVLERGQTTNPRGPKGCLVA